MDAKILEAFNDLSKALDKVAEAVKDKTDAKSDAAKLLQKINSLDKKIDAINKGVKELKKDTQKILNNQETLLRLSKEKKTEVFETASEKKEKIKDGATTVLIIAGSILALGVAFKLLNSVNFVQVIALAITLPLIAKAFEIINESGIKTKDLPRLFLIVTVLSYALTTSSKILKNIIPINPAQGLTAIFIAGVFAIIAWDIQKLVLGANKISLTDLVKIPGLLLVVSWAITKSSSIMKDIVPIGFDQGLTAIFIAGVFAIVAFSIETLTTNIKNVKLKDVILLPAMLVALSFALVKSSEILVNTKPIKIEQGITAIFIAGVFALLSLSVMMITKNLKNVKIGDVILLPLLLVGLSYALVGASKVLSHITPLKFEQGLTAIAVAIVLAAVSGVLLILSYAVEKIGLARIILLTWGLPHIAQALVDSSAVLGTIKPINTSLLFNMFLQSVSLAGIAISLGIAMFVLKTLGVTVQAAFFGGLTIIEIAGTLAISSQLISRGNYTNAPSLDWAIGVGISILAFGFTLVLLDQFGLTDKEGLLAATIGAGVLIIIAGTIWATSWILATGNYKEGGYPNLNWAMGVGLSLAAFGGVMALLGLGGPATLVLLGMGAGSLLLIAGTIWATSWILAKGTYKKDGYPSLDWAEGVSKSLAAFASTLGKVGLGGVLLNSIGSILGQGPVDIAQQIVDVNDKLKDVTKWATINETWASTVLPLMSTFIQIGSAQGFGDFLAGKFGAGPVDIAQQIVDVNNKLKETKFDSSIPDGYMKSISDNIKSYVDLVEYLQNKNIGISSYFSIIGVTSGLARLANDYGKLAKGVKSLGDALDTIDMEKLNALNMVSGSIVLMSLMDSEQFEKMMDALEEKAGIFVKTINMLQDEASSSGSSFFSMSSSKSNSNNEVVNVLNQIKTNTDNLGSLSSLASLPGAINSLNTKLQSLIDELKSESKTRKSGGR